MRIDFDALLEWLRTLAASVWTADVQETVLAGVAQGAHFIENPIVRTVGLLLIVFFTIRAIAAIYGGDIQNGKLGPVGLRSHSAQSLTKHDVRMPRSLMPMSLDGVRATCEIFYIFSDRNGRRVERRVHVIENAKINVVAANLTKVQATQFGQEMTDAIRALHSEDVRFPSPDLDTEPPLVEPTSATVGTYVDQHKIVEKWVEDDSALIVSVHAEVLKRVGDEREEFIVKAAEKLRAAREGSWWARRRIGVLARRRPNVIGSYYVRFKLSRDPLFILTRHPDRDLKMTAWLTVLTSIFAMIMEAWPLQLGLSSAQADATRPPHESSARPGPRPHGQ